MIGFYSALVLFSSLPRIISFLTLNSRISRRRENALKLSNEADSFLDQFSKEVLDKTVLGYLGPLFSTVGKQTTDSVDGMISRFPWLKGVSVDTTKLPLRFPALERNFDQLKEVYPKFFTDAFPGMGKEEASGWLAYLDIAHYSSFLTEDIRNLLLDQPLIFRLGIGIIGLEVIPTILNFLLLNFVWKSISNKDKSNIDISGLPKKYDITQISNYFQQNPELVFNRILSLLTESKDFLFGLLQDDLSKNWDATRSQRAVQLRELLTRLGPAYIKVGQGLSIRPDLLEPEYIEELGKLQDQVPPFDSQVALSIIQSDLKQSPEELFESLSAFQKPIASASLGQVYRAKLKGTGEEVAVKVQRPDMLLLVSLDLFVSRLIFQLGTLVPKFEKQASAFIDVIDNWAGRFIDELDYVTEASNSERFRTQMTDKTTTLGDAIVVPKVYKSYSSGKVLTTEWIEGTKLGNIDVSKEEGKATVRKLTRVLLNSYLVQLLETGFLHADPHPGNFKVTSDGKLCILDYGLMTELDENKRLATLDYVSHLLVQDYEGTLDDLIALGFIPDSISADPSKKAIVAPLLGKVLEQLAAGGGGNSINIDQVSKQIEELGEQYPIVIPPYFALVFRAFGALEGLGLTVDPNYSIVQECFPYLSKRLLSDDSPRIRDALKTFLYGKEGRLNVKRVDSLATGYRTFTTTAADAASGKAFAELKYPTLATASNVGATGETDDATDPTLSAAVRILFSPQGNFVQELLIEETVRIADALTRSISKTAIERAKDVVIRPLSLLNRPVADASVDTSKRGLNTFPLVSPLAPIARAIRGVENVLEISPDDIESLRTLKRLLQILANVERSDYGNDSSAGTLDAEDVALLRQVLSKFRASDLLRTASPGQVTTTIRSLLPLLRDVAPGIRSLVIRFSRRFAGRSSLTRIADKISPVRDTVVN